MKVENFTPKGKIFKPGGMGNGLTPWPNYNGLSDIRALTSLSYDDPSLRPYPFSHIQQ